jgi:hypothetical protein
VVRARPYDVADVRRAFAARGTDVRIPEAGVALGWNGEGPTGYKASDVAPAEDAEMMRAGLTELR